eukprot:TRINITY_DN2588_c0_g2_i2.p1 TRINITY_DN2588_c0_g2~~TRINITY_DN2588_c0_g2_i2.p1  ORF type:complete len:429 (+),score=69.61 TRINITY_DN2588_c0_g2_i2:180-1466(+)
MISKITIFALLFVSTAVQGQDSIFITVNAVGTSQNVRNVGQAVADAVVKIEEACKKDEFLLLLQQTKKLGPEEFTAQGICNVLQSAARVDIYDLDLIQIFLDDAKKRLDEFDSFGIGLLMRQVKDFRYYDEEFLDIVKEMIESQQLRGVNLEEGWSIISAFAAFSSIKMDTKNVAAILQHQIESIAIKNDFYTIGILCDHVLNLSILGVNIEASQKICQNIEYFLKENENQDQDHPNLFKLQQANFFYAIQDLQLNLPEDLEIASTVAAKLISQKISQNNFQLQYQQKYLQQKQQQQQKNNLSSLNERIFQHVYDFFKDREDVLVVKQFTLNQIGLCVDISIVHVEYETVDEQTGQNQVKVIKKVAIQVENEISCTLNKPYKLLADRQKLQQLLMQFGWLVVTVPFYEQNNEDFFQKIIENVKNSMQL